MRIAALWAVLAAFGLAQHPVQPFPETAQLEPILAQLAKYDYGQSPEPLYQLTIFVQDAMGSPARIRPIETRLDQFLQSDAPLAAKQAASRQLSLIATEASVPVLGAMLMHADTAEMARYALARIPGPRVGEVLRKALDGTAQSARIGVINSLGQRRDPQAVPALRSLITASDAGVAQAAIRALGQIGNRAALEALSAGMAQPVLEAYLECAGRLALGGDRNAASKAYRRLLAERTPPMIRVAALIGLAKVEEKNALPTLSAATADKDPQVQSVAVRLVAGIPGRESTAALMDRFATLEAAGQVRVLAALAGHGDPVARALVTQAARSESVGVRTAALAALGILGDESSVGPLAQAAASSVGAEQAVARQSLYGLAAPGVDSAIVAAIGSSSGKVKAELILAAGERGNAGAADTLILAARPADPDIRPSALRALRNVAGPAQVPALIEIVTTSGAGDRDASFALAGALRRSPPGAIQQLVSAYQAGSAVGLRLALIDVMGQVSSGETLPLLRNGLKDSNPEIVRGAILALTGWADPIPLADLLVSAKTNADPALQVLALRGCLKLVALPGTRPAGESVSLLAEVMALAKQPQEKKAILALLPVYPCQEALRLAQDAMADPEVTAEAKASVERLKNALKLK